MGRSSFVETEAGDGTRTHDPQLGKLMLYQLSYTRVVAILPLRLEPTAD